MQDFASPSTARSGHRARKLVALGTGFALGVAALALLMGRSGSDAAQMPAAAAKAQTADRSRSTVVPLALPTAGTRQTATMPQDRPLAADAAAQPAPAEAVATTASAEDDRWRTFKVKSGDNLVALFKRAGVPSAQMYRLLSLGDKVDTLTHLYPGEKLEMITSAEGELEKLRYALDDDARLLVVRSGDGFSAHKIELPVEHRPQLVSATIDSSFYAAAQDAGLSDNLIMEFAGIFGWDVDFAHDIRDGDRFTVLYDQLYRHGAKLRDGDILAAEFVIRGKTYRAVRYDDGHYYTPDGKSMRKAFLRSPVDFRRISSRFAKQRCHPILGICRPHQGVDFAAPTGTPIKAAGDGKIAFRGWKGGYGRAIIIQHGGHISTLYGHMSRFRGGLKRGSRVKQGQVIGYVGMSGLATGPHLHYEFRVNGVHHDPLKVKLPQARPISAKLKADFLQKTQPLLAQLDTYKRSLVAMNRR